MLSSIASKILNFLDENISGFKEFHLWVNQPQNEYLLYYIGLGMIICGGVIVYFKVKKLSNFPNN